MQFIGFLFLVLTFVSITSCRSVYTRSFTEDQGAPAITSQGDELPDRAQSDSIWPSRWGDGQIRPGTSTGVIVELDHPASQLSPAHLSRFHQLRTGETEYSDMDALASGIGITESYKFQAEGPGCFVFVHTPPAPDEHPPEPEDGEPELAFKFITAQLDPLAMTSEDGEQHLKLERTWFTYRSAREGADPVGTVLLIPGMFGTPEPVIEGVERYLRSKGWGVLRMLSHPSRFTQRQQFAVVEGDEARVASKIASMFDTRSAEAAYAASSAMRFVHERFPDNATKPVVLLGMSGGAMILPTVYSFDPDLYSAGVLIAGGGNFLEINVRSNYAKWIDAIDLDADPSDPEIQELEDHQLRELVDLYMLSSKLDSLHTAESMVDVPVLMLHGSTDKAVPASTGDALYEALGRPDRWTYPVGHELIFAGLPLQTPKIERWIRAQVLEDQED